MKKIRTEVQKKFSTLPDDIKELLSSTALVDTVDEVASQFGLDESDANLVIEVCTRLLIADIGPTEFIPLLKNDLAVNDEIANKLAKELNHVVFAPVKTSLLMLHSRVAPNISSTSLPASASTLAPGLAARVEQVQGIAATDATPKSVFEQKLGKTFAAPPAMSDATKSTQPNDPYREAV